jgi:spermidine synthase
MVPDPFSGRLAVLAFASGALTIGLEVAWLRMFAQVLDNSVYAFSAIVVVALVAFALASMAVGARPMPRSPAPAVAALLAATAALVAAQPRAFVAFTSGLAPISGVEGWAAYVADVFAMAALFVGVPAFAAGLLFPALLRLAAPEEAAGRPVGRLLAINTAGAITGSLAVSFVLLPAFGLWITITAAAAAYAILALWTAPRPAVIGLAALAGLGAAANATLAPLRLDDRRDERLLALWEGSYGTVAVTEGNSGRVLRLNNSYSLGGTVDRIERERIQTLIPLLLHPDPADVFFLGLGTGITAGEAIRHPVDRVVVSELVPEVVQASREYFNEWTRGLAADPRVEIRAEDGRHYLAATGDSFDVVIADLFVPWHAGTGSLYTREHFRIVRERLRPGGLFAQWLPLYQLSQEEFEVIARTLLEVFPHVVLWRGDFYANRPIAALVASASPMALDPDRIAARAAALPGGDRLALARLLPYYAGNLAEGRDVLGPGAVNTDGRPVIEYLSPMAQWGGAGEDEPPQLVSMPLVRFLARLRAEVPLERDPYVAGLTGEHRAWIDSGVYYQRAIVLSLEGDDDAAQRELAEALRRLPPALSVAGPFMALDSLVQ